MADRENFAWGRESGGIWHGMGALHGGRGREGVDRDRGQAGHDGLEGQALRLGTGGEVMGCRKREVTGGQGSRLIAFMSSANWHRSHGWRLRLFFKGQFTCFV